MKKEDGQTHPFVSIIQCLFGVLDEELLESLLFSQSFEDALYVASCSDEFGLQRILVIPGHVVDGMVACDQHERRQDDLGIFV